MIKIVHIPYKNKINKINSYPEICETQGTNLGHKCLFYEKSHYIGPRVCLYWSVSNSVATGCLGITRIS